MTASKGSPSTAHPGSTCSTGVWKRIRGVTPKCPAYARRYAWICSAAGCSGCDSGAGKSENAVIARLVFVCMPGHTPLCGAPVSHCPPRSPLASNSVGSKPASSACLAATSPLGPAPITATRAPAGSRIGRRYPIAAAFSARAAP